MRNMMNKWMWMVGLTSIVLLHQNFDFAPRFNNIKEDIRANHAKELLGSEYKGSHAQKAGSINALHLSLFNEIYANLSEKNKYQAANITSSILRESAKYGIDPIFVAAVIRTESHFNHQAIGSAGEIGLMQIKPTTAAWIASKTKMTFKGKQSLFQPSENIKLGVAYMAWLRNRFEKKAGVYVTAYNVGAQKIRRLTQEERSKQPYSGKVLNNYRRTYASIVAAKETSLFGKIVIASN